MFTKTCLWGALLGLAVVPLPAQTTAIQGEYLNGYDFTGAPPNALRDQNGVPLDAGTPAAEDGDVLQFGYFAGITTATDVSTFGQAQWDSFTPLTSSGGRIITTIGDAGGVEGNLGIFTINISLDPNLDPELPATFPVRLGIRFFNSTSVATATHFNLVTSNENGWRLFAPATPPPTPPGFMNLDDSAATFYWQSGPGGAFQTVLSLAPEPSTLGLLLLGGLSLALRRDRRS